MAAKRWDPESGELVIDSDDYDVTARKWIRNVNPPKQTTPSDQEAHEEFLNILTISQDKKTGFVTIAVEHYSPTVAKHWVDWLVADLNSTIMHQDVAEAEQAIEYLTRQIENTSLSDLQNVFFSLIEEQKKTIMLANVSEEYLFKTLDPAVTPEEKAKPKRAVIVILSTLIGFLISMILVKTLHVISGGRSGEP
jgi:LPS O-antigen subunit length determinant protein (WzzB/FepE family)